MIPVPCLAVDMCPFNPMTPTGRVVWFVRIALFLTSLGRYCGRAVGLTVLLMLFFSIILYISCECKIYVKYAM